MPKSAKQKKAKVADFSKAKFKLGKGKQQANNATDTSYKARSIVLPNQSISVEHDETVPLTKRNHTFADLIVQSKHYNAGIRKDAIYGLKEILTAYPSLRVKELSSVVGVIVRYINDEDSSVRKTLPVFLSHLLSILPHSGLIPHLPVIFLHFSSALSHIFPEVRIDAVKSFRVLLEHYPSLCVEGWVQNRGTGGRAGEGLMGVLGLGGGNNGGKQQAGVASVPLKSGAKLIVLQALEKFLKAALDSNMPSTSTASATSSSSSIAATSRESTWFFAHSFASPVAFAEFSNSLTSTPSSSAGRVDSWALGTTPDAWDLSSLAINSSSLSSSSLISSSPAEGREGSGIQPVERREKARAAAGMYQSLHPLLLSTFLDAAPGAFDPSGSITQVSVAGEELELIAVVGELASVLGRTVMGNSESLPRETLSGVKKGLRTMLNHMAVYFPFNSSTFQKRDVKSESLLLSLSLAFSSLVAQVSLTHSSVAPRTKSSNPTERKKALEECYTRMRKGTGASEKVLVDKVAVWVSELLRGETVSASSPLGQSLPSHTYEALLPTIWSLLCQPPPAPAVKTDQTASPVENGKNVSLLIGKAVFEHYNRLKSLDPTKKIGLEFLGRLCLLETFTLYNGPFRLREPSSVLTSGLASEVENFFKTLPRIIWEAGSKDLQLSELVLRLTQTMLKTYLNRILPAILPSFPSYFTMNIPSRGALPGPWTKLPLEGRGRVVRMLAIDTAWLLCNLSILEGSAVADKDQRQALEKAVEQAVDVVAVEDKGEASRYWVGLKELKR
ncbi:Uncharacterized conserved protein [Phaffia rhodozyma]|uniref:Pre-rRNA-processing protein n=1 Tax=Phaffia rhodozyma TaxID=264483 RepID=A0A0F7SRI0_PHARH|nr:Uncharacterized conserved protein [Phaffia rhodozyma]